MTGQTFFSLIKDLKKYKSAKKAKAQERFFKTGKDEYGEGDIFLGINLPILHRIVKKYTELTFDDLQILLNSKIHEHRLMALFILISQYEKEENIREKIVRFYLKNSKKINNWDLVDLSAPNILGNWFLDHPREPLYKYARSNNLWQKRIAIMSTLTFIKKGELEDTFKIAKILLYDKHDLIHKAVGWMLRETGKIDRIKEEEFLKKHLNEMPRTMLRYAIEKFPEPLRQKFLKKDE